MYYQLVKRRKILEIIKLDLENKNHDVSYQNEFIDDIVLNFDKRMLIIFFYLIHRFQQDTNSIEVSVKEIKKIIDNKRREKEYIKKIVEKLYDTAVYYKANETIVEDGQIKANKNDYIKDHLFDILVFSEDESRLKFLIKERYRKYFLNLQDNFTTTAIEIFRNLKL